MIMASKAYRQQGNIGLFDNEDTSISVKIDSEPWLYLTIKENAT